MKLFLKILAGLALFFVVILIGIKIYFTDARLKALILPEVRATVGTEVQVEKMSVTFFKTFPNVGVELSHFVLPDPEGQLVASLEKLLVGVELMPLMRDEISISRLVLNRPEVHYTIAENGSSNIDFLLALAGEPDEAASDESSYAVNIPKFSIKSAHLFYVDEASKISAELKELDADISLNYSALIETKVDARLGSLTLVMDGVNYVDNLALSLNQSSVLDLEREELSLTEGVFSIRGLAMNVAGSVSAWSSDAMQLDLSFSSSSDNFGELLRLAPPEFDEYLAGLESRGALQLEGDVSGAVGGDVLPKINFTLKVQDGYLKNQELPEAIEHIQIEFTANNELAVLQRFNARAGNNVIEASGEIKHPLEENATFTLNFDGNVNLATISGFYPIHEMGIQKLSGDLAAHVSANGSVSALENAAFNGRFILRQGLLQYADVPEAIQQINANINATQQRVTIENTEFTAATNRFSMAGNITNPLDSDNMQVDINAKLNFDLASIPKFYPIDEDTLQLRGTFSAHVNLKGKMDADHPEKLLQNSTFTLSNGYVKHKSLANALEAITLDAQANASRLNIKTAQFRTGQNALAMNGSVTDYLSEHPQFDVTLKGDAVLSDILNYYPLEPWVQQLSGTANLNLKASGPAGDPLKVQLNGALELSEVSAAGDSLPLPVSNLGGTLALTPNTASLQNFAMQLGSSDINLDGEMHNYLGMMEENPAANRRPSISGTYHSSVLNLDEMIDWDAESSDKPIFIELPNMDAAVTASISKLIILGLNITDISGSAKMNPDAIRLENATASLFEGTAQGNLIWEVPRPDRTKMTFNGTLENLTAEAFFRDTGFLGEKSTIHNYVSGALSANLQYATSLDATLAPDISTTTAKGNFGMTRARLAHHPIQEKIADLLKIPELSTVALDSWNAVFSIADEVLTFSDFNLTSEGIGLELDGTMNLSSDAINFKTTLILPERFKRGISSVLPNRAADALQREDGTIAVPLVITGTMANPAVRQDNAIIERIIQDYLKDQGGRLLNRIFGDN